MNMEKKFKMIQKQGICSQNSVTYVRCQDSRKGQGDLLDISCLEFEK